MSAATATTATRGQTLVQRAYVYVVALVAIHMVVLGAGNLLRVLAEIALGAPSGGFTGLPFLFNDFSQPRELYREQASLAIALLLVGTPAWWWHFTVARRAARAIEERASALRSLYAHLVVFVSALLVFGYGQRTLRLVLQGTTFGDTTRSGDLGLEPEWLARAAGAGAMALAAAIVLAFHLRLSMADRRAVRIEGRASDVRHLALYALAVVGFIFAAFSTTETLDQLLRRAVDAFVPLTGTSKPLTPPGVGLPPMPSEDDILRFRLLGAIPAIVAGLVLWLGAWIPLQRGLAAGPDADVERRSVVRKLAIYLVVLISAVFMLVSATIGLASIVQRALGDPVVTSYGSLWHDLASSLAGLVVFAPMWLFHRRVVEGEAARETEAARAATIRRLYTYLVCAVALAVTAIGAGGTLGVLGSQLLGTNTHDPPETALYVALVAVGGVAWAFHWRIARARLDDDERRSLPRRLYLYAAILGGVLGVLVFGSAALYRMLNAALAFSFSLATWHDIWHFAVDSAVAGTVAFWSFRALRADRAVLGVAGEETYAVTVLVRAADREAARARVRAAVAADGDLSVRG